VGQWGEAAATWPVEPGAGDESVNKDKRNAHRMVRTTRFAALGAGGCWGSSV